MNGIDATLQLRQKGYTIPIIDFSANSFEKDHCMKAGMDKFLVKPGNRHTICELIHARYTEMKLGPLPHLCSPKHPPKRNVSINSDVRTDQIQRSSISPKIFRTALLGSTMGRSSQIL
eukprot:TRINITY_DN1926_c0_g1_i1.p1 TRINITY_DN1926_c0_g1~~TRINITY_DN1926_c0_g1_i1.p1  ORF type:complete len:137 (-),score=29.23 TRINITY_DN1926_c0_g1_i1:66-419(-)